MSDEDDKQPSPSKDQPDHTEDPRKQDQGSEGYPETTHEEAADDGDSPEGDG
jgi:hypothetical protein